MTTTRAAESLYLILHGWLVHPSCPENLTYSIHCCTVFPIAGFLFHTSLTEICARAGTPWRRSSVMRVVGSMPSCRLGLPWSLEPQVENPKFWTEIEWKFRTKLERQVYNLKFWTEKWVKISNKNSPENCYCVTYFSYVEIRENEVISSIIVLLINSMWRKLQSKSSKQQNHLPVILTLSQWKLYRVNYFQLKVSSYLMKNVRLVIFMF